MPDDDKDTVPTEGEAAAPSDQQTEQPVTEQAQAPEQPTTPPPSETPASSSALTADEQLRGWIEDAVKQALPKHLESFATKNELRTAAQSASDQRFAKLMRELAPEMKGIDSAAKRGLIDEEQAKQAKKDLFVERASLLAGVEEEPPAQETPQTRAERAMREHGTWWNDYPEVQNGRTMPIEQFEALVQQRSTEKKAAPPVDLEALKAQVLKELLAKQEQDKKDAQAQAVREADKAGATKPPTEGNMKSQKKRTLADADDLGNAIAQTYFKQ